MGGKKVSFKKISHVHQVVQALCVFLIIYYYLPSVMSPRPQTPDRMTDASLTRCVDCDLNIDSFSADMDKLTRQSSAKQLIFPPRHSHLDVFPVAPDVCPHHPMRISAVAKRQSRIDGLLRNGGVSLAAPECMY